MHQIVEKEISETTASLSQQHTQCQWYVQTYLLAVSGLFAIAGFFGKDGTFSVQASAVGVTYALVVFFLGWIFLSVVAHKAAMIHMLYKHIASMRSLRVRDYPALREEYVLPLEKYQIKYGSLLKQLPYLFFVFNFVFVCSALAYFMSAHLAYYYQVVAIISAIVTLLGTFYPVVCISFNKHLGCAFKARSIRHKYILEAKWTRAVREAKRKFRFLKVFLLTLANLGAIGIAIFSLTEESSMYSREIIIACYVGVTIYAAIRYAMEVVRIRIGIDAVRQRIG